MPRSQVLHLVPGGLWRYLTGQTRPASLKQLLGPLTIAIRIASAQPRYMVETNDGGNRIPVLRRHRASTLGSITGFFLESAEAVERYKNRCR